MKDQATWIGKVFDEPRVGFVAEHGSQLYPLVKPPKPAPPPPPPGPSPLDKIIDENRRGFVAEQRASTVQKEQVRASKTDKRT